MIKFKNTSIGYDQKNIIEDLNLTIKENCITTIIGPNGCGKSTLLKAISKSLKPSSGNIYFHDTELKDYKTKDLAKDLAILPQNPSVPNDFTVYDLVSYGRYPHMTFLGQLKKTDREVINWALDKTDINHLKHRKVSTLSGGERQRAWIAMAVAQEPTLLLLDEPTTFLDIAHQFEVLKLVNDLHKNTNMSIVMVLHDINQAARYSDEIIVMKNGNVITQGKPEDSITEETLAKVFGLRGNFTESDGYRHFIPTQVV